MRHMDFIIGTVIKELKERDLTAGKIQVQKLIYFLKHMNVEVPYKYFISHYGPFSGSLSDKLDEMEFTHLIDEQNQGHDYSLDNLSNQELEYYKEEENLNGNVIKRKIEKILSVLPDLEFDNLELYATVHYCYDSLTLMKNNVEIDKLIKEVKKWKGGKFDKEEIIDAFNLLREGNIL